MDRETFKSKVMDKLRTYAPGRTEQELAEAMDEYADLIEEGYTHYQGVEYGYDYAAWNIAMCI